MEIETTRTVLNRLAVLASLGVPEIWRWDGENLQAGLLQADGTDEWGDRSRAFPQVPVAELGRFLRMIDQHDHLTIVRASRDWVRSVKTK